jgi:guanylate kinase
MNELKRIAEFRAVLANYQLSDSAKQILAETPLVLLVGPSGGGRNTIIDELRKLGTYHYIVSDTTRQIREKDGVPIEQNGREYWFRKEAELLEDLRRGEFLEAAIIHEQQVSGVSIREVAKARSDHAIAITDIEPAGAETIHAIKTDALVIFIVPPDFPEWMRRLRGRSDLPEDEVRRRLTTACKEIEAALSRPYYTIVANDQLTHAVADIDSLATTGRHDAAKELAARKLADQLLVEARAYLDQPAV